MSSKRTLVIGDIHAGLRALEQVLDRLDPTNDDTLIFLGDYVDGWSESVETIEYLIRLDKTNQCIFLIGNHDALCADWLRTGKDNPLWLEHGGRSTMDSYENADEQTVKRHLTFYGDLQDYYLDDQNRLFLHAGFTNLKGVTFEYFSSNFYWDRTLWEVALSLDPDLTEKDSTYPKRLMNYKEIYIGHSPVTKIGETSPLRAANVWNIDTGAAFKGPLSVMDINTKRVWQSEPVHTLYPGESGRNRPD